MYVYDLAPFYFLGISALLYAIATLSKDLLSHQNILLRLVGSPVKLIAFIFIIIGGMILYILVSWTNLNGFKDLWPIFAGITLYLIDNLFSKKRVGAKAYWTIQITVSLMVIGGLKPLSLYDNSKTIYIIPESAKNEVIILFGIEGYPALPNSFLWKKTVQIPESGLLVTSSLLEDLAGYKKDYINHEGQVISMHNLFVQEICSLDDDRLIIANYITPRSYYPTIPVGHSELQNTYQQLYDSICNGQLISKYTDTRDKQHKGKLRSEWLEIIKESEKNK